MAETKQREAWDFLLLMTLRAPQIQNMLKLWFPWGLAVPWFSCQILWHPCLLPYYLFILRATLPLPPFTPLPQQSSSVDLCSFHPNNVTHSRGLNSTSWIELVKSVNIIGIFFLKGKNNVIYCGQVRLHRRTRTLRQGKGREGGDVPGLRSRVMPRKRLVRQQ